MEQKAEWERKILNQRLQTRSSCCVLCGLHCSEKLLYSVTKSCLTLCDPMDCSLPVSYCSGLPFPPPGDLPNPGIKPSLLHLLLWLGYLNGGGGAPFTKIRFLISLKSMEDLITQGPSLLEPGRKPPLRWLCSTVPTTSYHLISTLADII